MTSMPASRSARAMTFAPRSWPSRPGFAMTTRIFCMLNERDLFVLGPDLAQRVAHLADGRIGADAVHQGIHRVRRAAGGRAERVEGAPHPIVVARPSQLLEPRDLAGAGRAAAL